MKNSLLPLPLLLGSQAAHIYSLASLTGTSP